MSKLSGNILFQEALKKAIQLLDKPDQVSIMMDSVQEKMDDLNENKKGLKSHFAKIRTLLRMLKAYITGQYREIPWKSIILICGALIYFLMPLDILPDFIPVTGFIDDISIILMVYKSLNKDIELFLMTENESPDI